MAVLGDKALKPFQSLAQQNPMQNSRFAQAMQGARTAGLQQAVAQAPQGLPTAQVAQQVGAQQAQQAGQIQLQAQQQTVQDQQKIAQAAMAAQEKQASLQLGKKELAMRVRADQLAGKLAQIDRNLKNKLLDETIQFEKDDMGRTLFNERQLLDYKLQNMRADIALQQYEQQAREMTDRRTKMLQVAYKKIEQELQQQQASGQQRLSQEQTMRLERARIDLQNKLQREANRKRNRAAMIGAATGIAGAVAGGLAAGPAGATAGYSAGQGLGTAAAAASE